MVETKTQTTYYWTPAFHLVDENELPQCVCCGIVANSEGTADQLETALQADIDLAATHLRECTITVDDDGNFLASDYDGPGDIETSMSTSEGVWITLDENSGLLEIGGWVDSGDLFIDLFNGEEIAPKHFLVERTKFYG